MDLRDFITATLVDIVEGASAAREKVMDKASIFPTTITVKGVGTERAVKEEFVHFVM